MIIAVFLSLLLFIPFSDELNNGLGLTPQMGWNSWNHFGCSINETIVRKTVDAIIATGLAAAGYEYVNLDDCWQRSRDAQGVIQADPITFPSGIPALTNYIHSRKLKFGLYSDRGNMTCQRRPGSLHYETKDAKTYAAWAVDYLKLDSCNLDNTPAEVEIGIMRDALNASGRPIFFSICGGGSGGDLGNSWRTTTDIQDYWSSMLANIDHNNNSAGIAGPGGWNVTLFENRMNRWGGSYLLITESEFHDKYFSICVSTLKALIIKLGHWSVRRRRITLVQKLRLGRMGWEYNRKFYPNSCFFFDDDWIELVELHYKKCVSNLKNKDNKK